MTIGLDDVNDTGAGPVTIRVDSDDFASLPAWRIRDLIAARKVSPTEVTEYFLRRIERLDPVLHAFRKIDAEGARRQARRAEADVMAGKLLGALHGVPVAIKELIAVAGMPFIDTLVLRQVTAERDALEVERIRRAGAVIVGVTVGGMTALEFGSSDAQPQNPWDRSRVCGDSSSGGACALASGMVPITLTNDALGSTRLPAAWCGRIGLIPTRGLVATTEWNHLLNRILAHSGPMSGDVRDAATMLSVIAGPDARDLLCLPDDAPDYLSKLDDGARNLRLVWTDDFGFAAAYAQAESAEVTRTVRRALHSLQDAGAEVVETGERIENPFVACGLTQLSDPGLGIRETLTHDEVAKTREMRGRIWQSLHRLLAGFDFLVSPTSQRIAPTREQWAAFWRDPIDWRSPSTGMAAYSALTSIANLLGWPAISVPAGLVNGMPVGLQILGRPRSEARMLQLAQAFAACVGPPAPAVEGS